MSNRHRRKLSIPSKPRGVILLFRCISDKRRAGEDLTFSPASFHRQTTACYIGTHSLCPDRLAASASYIAVPAARRTSVPEANPTLSPATSSGVTFPFNVLVAIPLYFAMATQAFALTGRLDA